MNPTRILPDLQASLLCEEVRQEINTNFLLIGILGVIRVPQLPIMAAKICVFNRWTAGVGAFEESVRLIGPDQTTLIRQSRVKFALQDPAHHATNVTVFGQLEFAVPGVHYVEVMVDEVMKLRFPLPVIVVPPPPGTQPQPPPPSPPRRTEDPA